MGKTEESGVGRDPKRNGVDWILEKEGRWRRAAFVQVSMGVDFEQAKAGVFLSWD